jgi:hypothetical protein
MVVNVKDNMDHDESIKKAIESLSTCHDGLLYGDIKLDNRLLSHLINLCNTFVDDYYQLTMNDIKDN